MNNYELSQALQTVRNKSIEKIESRFNERAVNSAACYVGYKTRYDSFPKFITRLHVENGVLLFDGYFLSDESSFENMSCIELTTDTLCDISLQTWSHE